MRFDFSRLGPDAWIRFEGDFTLAHARRARSVFDKVIGFATGRITVDLTDVAYIDSSGLATLVDASQRIRKAGGTMRLHGVHDRLMAVIDLVGLRSILAFE